MAVTRSGFVSPFRSPIATEVAAAEPTAKGLPGAARKPPEPSPSSTVTSSELKLALTKSGFVSPFRSPIATEIGVRANAEGAARGGGEVDRVRRLGLRGDDQKHNEGDE